MRIFSNSPQIKVYTGRALMPKHPEEKNLFHRQGLVPGFDQVIFSRLRAFLVGAGALGGEIGEAFVRKGIGRLHIFDRDRVELSNLNRQKFFKRDLGKNKAIRLAKNLSDQAFGGSVVTGYGLSIEEAFTEGFVPDCDIAVVGVDNEEARVFCSKTFRVPMIFAAVAVDADRLYVAIQKPGEACYRCIIPEPSGTQSHRCYLPGSIDPSKIIGGLVSFAVDSIFMKREREWNYKEINLVGYLPERSEYFKKGSECPLCGPAEHQVNISSF